MLSTPGGRIGQHGWRAASGDRAAFALAVHRHFGPDTTPTDVAALRSPGSAPGIRRDDPLPALEMEGLIRAALGEPELVDNIPPETALRSRNLRPRAILLEQAEPGGARRVRGGGSSSSPPGRREVPPSPDRPAGRQCLKSGAASSVMVPLTKAVQATGAKLRIPAVGALESRTSISVPRSRTSTHWPLLRNGSTCARRYAPCSLSSLMNFIDSAGDLAGILRLSYAAESRARSRLDSRTATSKRLDVAQRRVVVLKLSRAKPQVSARRAPASKRST